MASSSRNVALFGGMMVFLVLVVAGLAMSQPALLLAAVVVLIGLGAWWLARARALLRNRVAALEEEAADLRAITAVSRAVRSSLNLEDLLTTLYLQTTKRLGVRHFFVALLDPEAEDMLRFPLAIEDRRGVKRPPRPAANGLVEHVIITRAALRIARDVAARAAELGRDAPDAAIVSWMGAPLWSGVPLSADRPIGCVVVESHDPDLHFTARDLDLFTAMVGQAGAAIGNAQLYARAGAQLSALDAIVREIAATLDMQRIFALVLEGAIQATGSSAGTIRLRSEEESADRMDLVAMHGYPQQAMYDLQRWGSVPAEGVTGAVLRTGEAAVLDDVSETDEALVTHPETRAQVSVPIRMEGEVVGVITLESERPGAYQAREMGFLTQLANQTAVALRNARLFQEARAGRDRLQAVLDSTHEGMVMIDFDGRVVLMNPQAEQLTGLPSAQWRAGALTKLSQLGLQAHKRLGFEKPDVLLDVLNGLQTGELPELETVRYPFSARHLERTTTPVCDGDGHLIGLLVVLRDVTEQVNLQQAREALTRMIVHDLRSPLAAVQGSLNLIVGLAPAADEVGEVLARTAGHSLRAAGRLMNMIESMLDISRMEQDRLELDREPLTLMPVVETVFDDLRPLAGELDVRLVAEAADPALLLDIDSDRVRRVLTNLVDNALKFAPAESAVCVATRTPVDGFVRVEVIDQGPGIPDEEKAHLFDAFVQVEGRRGRRRGTGLGLTFCRTAVEAHGGQIWIEDGAEGGSVFAFTLPLAEIAPLPPEE